jgi:hypothetical protein
MRTFSCGEDPGRPERVLAGWLDLLGPSAVRERGDGIARLLEHPEGGAVRERDHLLRWRRRADALDVQVSCPSGNLGGFSRECLASLSFAMEANGVRGEDAPSSGCAPPRAESPRSPDWREATDLEFKAMGLVLLHDGAEMDANVSFYGRPGGAAEWHVDCDGLGGASPTIEVSHDAAPFDAKGENALLRRILERLGVTPWGLR